jgi:ribonucrease Y
LPHDIRALLIGFALVAAAAVVMFVLLRWHLLQQRKSLSKLQQDLEKESAGLEARRKEALLEAKDEAHRLRKEIERENRDRRQDLQRTERRLSQREETIERRAEALEKRERLIEGKEGEVGRLKELAENERQHWREEVERVAGLSAEEARRLVLEEAEREARHEAAMLLEQIEEETKRESDRRGREIISLAIQRCAVDQVTETTVAAVALPTDEMKGRIIGREGRNIRSFEQLTGVDLIIDDTPEAVVISSFDPIRRETARLALETLISDGRIHPGRIEEAVSRAQALMEERIQEAGDRAVFETGVTGLHPELVRLLGKMKFRTTLGQNALDHSIEVSGIAGVLAAELRANEAVARRAGLLHDIGKAVDFEREGTHPEIGGELARKFGEPPVVVNAIESHHDDCEVIHPIAVLVAAADALSGARPGARRRTTVDYLRRVARLEELARSFQGVETCYALQAGREIRVIVEAGKVSDDGTALLAHDLSQRIQAEMDYPGRIKVTVIRELRAQAVAH